MYYKIPSYKMPQTHKHGEMESLVAEDRETLGEGRSVDLDW